MNYTVHVYINFTLVLKAGHPLHPTLFVCMRVHVYVLDMCIRPYMYMFVRSIQCTCLCSMCLDNYGGH